MKAQEILINRIIEQNKDMLEDIKRLENHLMKKSEENGVEYQLLEDYIYHAERAMKNVKSNLCDYLDVAKKEGVL